jgi:hypothetical protein
VCGGPEPAIGVSCGARQQTRTTKDAADANRRKTAAILPSARAEHRARSIGDPITSVVCYCERCQEGSRQIEALPNGLPARGSDGGTASCSTGRIASSTRRDTITTGHKLRDESSTSGSSPPAAVRPCSWLSRKGTGFRYTGRRCGGLAAWRCASTRRSKPTGIDLPTTCPPTRDIPSGSWRALHRLDRDAARR